MSRSRKNKRKRSKPRGRTTKKAANNRHGLKSIWKWIWQIIAGVGIIIAIAVGSKTLFWDSKKNQIVIEQPRFSEDVNDFTVSLGGMGATYNRATLEKGPEEPFKFKEYRPIKIYIEDGQLYADLSVYAGLGLPPIRIKKNIVYGKPDQWDINSNDRALEIVTDEHKPIYQFIYKTPSQIVITGILPIPNGLVIATETGTVVNPIGRAVFKLNRIFKYPSWKYPGDYE